MKKLFSYVLFSLLVGFSTSSCSDDDAKKEVTHLSTEQMIIGRWYPQGGTINGGEFVPYPENDCETQSNYEEFDGTQITFVGYNQQCEVNETNSSPYIISDNVLTVMGTNGFSDMDYNIVSLTSQELILQTTYNTPEGMVTTVIHYHRNID